MEKPIDNVLKCPATGVDASSVKQKTLLKLGKFINDSADAIYKPFNNFDKSDHISQTSAQMVIRPSSINNKSSDVPTLLTARQLNLKLTPLENQVVNIKEQHPDLLLIVECGYKYQCYGEVLQSFIYDTFIFFYLYY